MKVEFFFLRRKRAAALLIKEYENQMKEKKQCHVEHVPSR